MLRFAITGLEVPYFHDLQGACGGAAAEAGFPNWDGHRWWALDPVFFRSFLREVESFHFFRRLFMSFQYFSRSFQDFSVAYVALTENGVTGDISLVLFRESHWGRCWWPPTTDTPSNGPSKRWPSWQWARLMCPLWVETHLLPNTWGGLTFWHRNLFVVFIQWEFQDPKMEVLYQIRPYFPGIFPYIGLS